MKKIVKMVLFHCAKGTRGCEKCKTLAAEGEKYCLIKLHPIGGIVARPMMQIDHEGEKIWFEFDIDNVFKNEAAALDYAKDNDIDILKN